MHEIWEFIRGSGLHALRQVDDRQDDQDEHEYAATDVHGTLLASWLRRHVPPRDRAETRLGHVCPGPPRCARSAELLAATNDAHEHHGAERCHREDDPADEHRASGDEHEPEQPSQQEEGDPEPQQSHASSVAGDCERCVKSGLGVRLGGRAVELVRDERLVTDDPRIVTGLDHVARLRRPLRLRSRRRAGRGSCRR